MQRKCHKGSHIRRYLIRWVWILYGYGSSLADGGEGDGALNGPPWIVQTARTAVQRWGLEAAMSIGLGAAIGLWVISGVAFWSAFVALGCRFRPTDEPDGASVAAPDAATSRHAPSRAAPDHVLTRSRR